MLAVRKKFRKSNFLFCWKMILLILGDFTALFPLFEQRHHDAVQLAYREGTISMFMLLYVMTVWISLAFQTAHLSI